MTNPPQWQQPTVSKADRNRKINKILLPSLAGVLVLCCGGMWAIGTFIAPDDDADKASVAATTTTPKQPPLAAPAASTAPPAVTSDSPTPSSAAPKVSLQRVAPSTRPATAAAKPKPKPKPKPSKTTTRPKPKPTSFTNCTELRRVYPNGVPAGHPAYASKHDRDKDDWACERS